MNVRTARRVVWMLAFSCVSVAPVLAQTPRPGSPSELMAALKVGQWVKLEGPAGKSPTVMCTEAKMLTGDFLDDDYEISANVRRVDAAKGLLVLFTLPARLRDDAEFKGGSDTFKGLAQVKTGMYLNLEGTFLKDGSFLAKKVNERGAELEKKPQHVGRVWVKGRIDKVDAGSRTVTVMGIPYVITSSTRVKSVIR